MGKASGEEFSSAGVSRESVVREQVFQRWHALPFPTLACAPPQSHALRCSCPSPTPEQVHYRCYYEPQLLQGRPERQVAAVDGGAKLVTLAQPHGWTLDSALAYEAAGRGGRVSTHLVAPQKVPDDSSIELTSVGKLAVGCRLREVARLDKARGLMLAYAAVVEWPAAEAAAAAAAPPPPRVDGQRLLLPQLWGRGEPHLPAGAVPHRGRAQGVLALAAACCVQLCIARCMQHREKRMRHCMRRMQMRLAQSMQHREIRMRHCMRRMRPRMQLRMDPHSAPCSAAAPSHRLNLNGTASLAADATSV